MIYVFETLQVSQVFFFFLTDYPEPSNSVALDHEPSD